MSYHNNGWDWEPFFFGDETGFSFHLKKRKEKDLFLLKREKGSSVKEISVREKVLNLKVERGTKSSLA